MTFPTCRIVFVTTFKLLHADTCNPYHTKTHVGHRYFFTIVDNYIRATWAYLMVIKDEVDSVIKSFVIKAQT